MPIATYKLYKCPKCGSEKTLYQGDVLTSFPMCKKCHCYMELQGDAPQTIFTILKRSFGMKG